MISEFPIASPEGRQQVLIREGKEKAAGEPPAEAVETRPSSCPFRSRQGSRFSLQRFAETAFALADGFLTLVLAASSETPIAMAAFDAGWLVMRNHLPASRVNVLLESDCLSSGSDSPFTLPTPRTNRVEAAKFVALLLHLQVMKKRLVGVFVIVSGDATPARTRRMYCA